MEPENDVMVFQGFLDKHRLYLSKIESLTHQFKTKQAPSLRSSLSSSRSALHDETIHKKLDVMQKVALGVDTELTGELINRSVKAQPHPEKSAELVSLEKERASLRELYSSCKQSLEDTNSDIQRLEGDKRKLVEVLDKVCHDSDLLFNRISQLHIKWTAMFNSITLKINEKNHSISTSNETLRREINKEILSFSVDSKQRGPLTVPKMIDLASALKFFQSEKDKEKVKRQMRLRTPPDGLLLLEEPVVLGTMVKEKRQEEIAMIWKVEDKEKRMLPSENILDKLQKPSRLSPVTKEFWKQQEDTEGRLKDPDQLKTFINQGGLDPSIRKKAWKYLFNFYPWHSTKADRSKIKAIKSEEYNALRKRWESMSEEQISNFDEYGIRLNFIKSHIFPAVEPLVGSRGLLGSNRGAEEGKAKAYPTATATGAAQAASLEALLEECGYKGDKKSEVINLMFSILKSYNFYNWNLGYSAGMAHVLLPFVKLFENEEYIIFWCFKDLMDHISPSFDYKNRGLLVSIIKLSRVINQMDPWFYSILALSGSLDLLFCLRWIQLLFVEVFQLDQIFTLWESLFTASLEHNKGQGGGGGGGGCEGGGGGGGGRGGNTKAAGGIGAAGTLLNDWNDFIIFFVFGILLQCRENILIYHSSEWSYNEMTTEMETVAKKLNLHKCLNIATSLAIEFHKMGFPLT